MMMAPSRVAAALEALAPLLDAGFTVYYEGGACLRVWFRCSLRYVSVASIETADDPCLYVRAVFA